MRTEGWARGLVAPALISVVVVLPNSLLAALFVLMRQDIPVTDVALGAVVSANSAIAAIVSAPGGRLSERLGAPLTMRFCALASGVTLLGLAFAQSFWMLLVFMLLGGVSSSLAMTSTNLAIAEGVAPRRLGLALGAKQSAVPLAILLAGLAVPAMGVTVGWRATFLIMTLPAVVFFALSWRMSTSGRRPDVGNLPASRPPLSLVLLAGAGSLAVTATIGANTFFIPSAVQAGMSIDAAGILLSVGAFAGIVARVSQGWFIDRGGKRSLLRVSALMAMGSVGFLLIGNAASAGALLVAALIGYFAGWGWNGLFIYSVVRLHESSPAAATGVTSTGMRIGGLAGPLLFGTLAEAYSYRFAWFVAAGLLVAAAGLVLVGRRRALFERHSSLAAS